MKHVIQIADESGVVELTQGVVQTEDEQEPLASWDKLVEAIDLRAHYVGPVLEHILHLDHESSPWILRE